MSMFSFVVGVMITRRPLLLGSAMASFPFKACANENEAFIAPKILEKLKFEVKKFLVEKKFGLKKLIQIFENVFRQLRRKLNLVPVGVHSLSYP